MRIQTLSRTCFLSLGLLLIAQHAQGQTSVNPSAAAHNRPEALPSSAVLWPTLTPTGDSPAAAGALHVPTERDGALRDRARDIDALLTDTAQDLGLALDLSRHRPDMPRGVRDLDLIETARTAHAWIISPRVERDGGELLLRFVAAPPDAKVVLVRVEHATAETLPLKVVVMLRDLVNAQHSSSILPLSSLEEPRTTEPMEPTLRTHSAGRAVLAVNLATFGGFTGLSLQKASQNEDPRLLYPLMALGTGVGLGASMIIADEWNVGLGDAWYLTAGSWWPTTSAFLLSAGYHVQPTGDRYAYALLSGMAGTGLASLVLSQTGIAEGAALMTHSGAVLGTFLGGATELLTRGTTDVGHLQPYKGLGFGAAAGVLLTGAAAIHIQIASSRVLLTDVGAGLGALAGAALASPLLFKNPTESSQRAWLGGTMAGTLVGAGVALWVTRNPAPPSARVSVSEQAARSSLSANSPLAYIPNMGMISSTTTRAGNLPVWGAQWSGVW